MFSKQNFRKILTAALALQLCGLVACSDFLNEKKQSPETIELSNERFACLQELPEQMSLYLEGKVSAAEVRRGFECGKDALVYFKTKTRGSMPDAYTLEDLRNFFGKYFLKRNNVSPEFGAQLFKIKKLILGGDEHFITKTELQKMVDLLDLLKEQAVQLSPHLPVLLGAQGDASWTDVNAAIEQLRLTSWILVKEFNLVRSDYGIDDLKKFFAGLDNFINANKSVGLFEKVNSSMPLIEAVKKVVIGEDAHFDNLSDWEDGLRTVLLIYKEALRYRYFIQKNELDSPREMNVWIAFLDDGLRIFEESLPIKRQGVISFSAVDTLLDRLADRNLLPKNLTATSLKETYKKIVLRLFDPRRQGDSRGLDGIEKNHFAAFQLEWKVYRLHQYFINGLNYDSQQSIGSTELRAAIQNFPAENYVTKALSQNSLEQEALLKSWAEGSAKLLSPWPILFNPAGRLMVVGRPASVHQTWSSLTRWNLMREFGRAMMIGYGPQGLAEHDLERWYEDFKLFGIELKAFDPRSGNTGARSFKEANFFTFSGNGDSKMDDRESFEYISILMAGGISSANVLRLDMIEKGCGLPENDIFGYPWLDEDCFKRNLRANAASYFDNMPGLVLQIAKMDSAHWDEFYHDLMTSARTSPAEGRRLETSDLRTAVMMLHYTEILFTVYDRNQSGSLEEGEIKLAAPRFLLFMKNLSPIKSNFVVSDFFLYLVVKGKKPSLADYLLFQGEKTFGSLGEVTRDKILRVFKVLKEEAAKK
jgi:hypothetical protein